MFSFAYVLDRVGYGRLILEVFVDPSEPRRSISGTTAILYDLIDDDEVRTRSDEGRSRGRSPSSSSLEAEERGLRVLELLWRSLSRSLSRSRSRSRSLSLVLGLVRSRSGSFLRRRCESEELNMLAAGGGAARYGGQPGSWASCCGRDHSCAAMGGFDWVYAAATSRGCAYQRSRPPCSCAAGRDSEGSRCRAGAGLAIPGRQES